MATRKDAAKTPAKTAKDKADAKTGKSAKTAKGAKKSDGRSRCKRSRHCRTTCCWPASARG